MNHRGTKTLRKKILFALCLCVFVAWGSGDPPPDRPNILIITVDTLRRDHLGCYGNSVVKTPNIDSIAKQSVIFDNFFSAANITIPSHVSIFTGTYPFHHGCYGNEPFEIAKQIPVVPLLLRTKGYITSGIAACFPFRVNWLRNFGQDFNTFYSPEVELKASEVTDRFENMVLPIRRRPFFYWLHYFDPHIPYRPPAQFRTKSAQPGTPLPDLDFTQGPWAWLKQDGVTTTEEASSLYAGEVSFVDHEIGRVFALLQKQSLLDNTIIIFVADHGENLGDHGVYYDHALLFDSTIHIPCFIYGKAFKTGRRKTLASTIDLAPTIMQLAGYEIPPEMDGKSLLPLLKSAKEQKLHSYVLSAHAGRHSVAVITDRFKFIRSYKPQYGQKERELYERSDTAEKTDVAESNPKMVHDLEALILPDNPRPAPIELNPEQKEILKSLGYIEN